jgi:hypothetical protein
MQDSFLKLCTFISEKMHVLVEYIVERGGAALGVNIYAPLEKRVYMINRPENDETKQKLDGGTWKCQRERER